jgi:6-pyruvoyltetrahydropterin/6-carboxytetrahydropterin synthase
VLYLTRKVTFCASHLYRNPSWSDAENERVFGKCVRCHGHNYVCEVTIRGAVEPSTGMVLNLTELDRILKTEVVEAYDHRFINEDVPGFDRLVPTTENLAVDIWNRVVGRLRGCELHRVRLYEDPDLFVDYLGDQA